MAIALVDVNNFYASCERLFRPELHGLPDRCALQQRWMRGVAQPEAKAWVSKWRALLQDPRAVRGAWRCGIQLQLRALAICLAGVMSTLEYHGPPELGSTPSMKRSWRCRSRFAGDLTAYGQQIRQRVWQWTG